MTEIHLPYKYKPRDYQMPAWEALEGGIKRACLVWHRRAGKDLFAINWCATQLFERVGLYWHILPTYTQGKKVVWEGMTRDGRPFLDHFPPGTVVRSRHDEMSLWFSNGSVYQVIGAEEYNRLVGANPVGIIFSEWSVMTPQVWEFMRPILAENGGWAIFIYTPRGQNHGYRTLKMAEEQPEWFSQVLPADLTEAVHPDLIDADRRSGMPEEMIQQEYYCSFDAPLVGSYYGDQLTNMLDEGRIGKVPWEPDRPVNTAWDLGISDATSIWFHQQVGKEHRLIDYYYSAGVGLEHYTKVLDRKPYTYGQHLLPHDVLVRELGTGKSRVEVLRRMGLNPTVVSKMALADGINAVRQFLPRCWVDEKKCDIGLQGLRQYTKEKLDERGPDGEALFRDQPLHNWASHPADALRALAVGLRREPQRDQKLAPDLAIV